MAERLTTDNPKNNTETMLNYAYAKDKQVYLRYGDGEEDINLCEYISRLAAKKSCHPTPEEVLAGECMECDCELAILYWVAVQAAELRGRLAKYEDLGSVEELAKLKQDKDSYYATFDGLREMIHELAGKLADTEEQIADGKLVEVVRCKDCQCAKPSLNDVYMCGTDYVQADHFCGSGERRGNNE